MDYFPKQLCKSSPAQAMRLAKMRQKLLLPYLIIILFKEPALTYDKASPPR